MKPRDRKLRRRETFIPSLSIQGPPAPPRQPNRPISNRPSLSCVVNAGRSAGGTKTHM